VVYAVVVGRARGGGCRVVKISAVMLSMIVMSHGDEENYVRFAGYVVENYT
jgi:hypothetical protein